MLWVDMKAPCLHRCPAFLSSTQATRVCLIMFLLLLCYTRVLFIATTLSTFSCRRIGCWLRSRSCTNSMALCSLPRTCIKLMSATAKILTFTATMFIGHLIGDCTTQMELTIQCSSRCCRLQDVRQCIPLSDNSPDRTSSGRSRPGKYGCSRSAWWQASVWQDQSS